MNTIPNLRNPTQGLLSLTVLALATFISANDLAGQYTVSISNCCTLLANQLNCPGGNTLANIMPSLPCDVSLFKWDNGSQAWSTNTYSTVSGWDDGAMTLNPGEGAYLCSSCTTSFAVTFTGTVPTPVLPVTLLPGHRYLVSRKYPGPGNYENIIGSSPTGGEWAYTYEDCVHQMFSFDPNDLAWYPYEPTTGVGKAIWILPPGTSALPPIPILTPPSVSALSFWDVTTTTATLYATVNPMGYPTAAWFQWGTTTNYGNLSAATGMGSGTSPLSFSVPIAGLTPGVTYHLCAVATNSNGAAYGSDVSFTTLGPPAVSTLPATAITATNAALNGTVNPNGYPTAAWFEWGTTTSYGSLSAATDMGSGTDDLPLSAPLSGLTPGITYHFRAVATNSNGAAYGIDQSFTTLRPPAVSTLPATAITATNAALNGTVNPNGYPTAAWFEWGTTTSYGNLTAVTDMGSGTDALPLSAALAGLNPGVIYHFRLVATNNAEAYSSDRSFTTLPPLPPPSVVTLPATARTTNSATLRGRVNPNGYPTAAWFEWGTTTNYGNLTAVTDMGSGTDALPLSVPIAGLAPGVTYHFLLAATNCPIPVYGSNQSFTTTADVYPVTLNIQAFIDGRDRLLIHNDTLQWLHYDNAAVGRWSGRNEPTIISTTLGSQTIMSNVAWVPTWPQPPPAEIRYPTNSSVFESLSPGLLLDANLAITLTPIMARGAVSIVQYPSVSNDFALLVEFNDNPIGAAEWYQVNVNLFIGSSPVVECRPSSQTAEQGSTVTWMAQASGYPPLSYQWFLNGTNVPSDPANGQLTLANVQFSQSGACTVVVTNRFGAVTSSPALLSVIAPVERRPTAAVKLMGEAGALLNVEYVNSLTGLLNWFPLDSVTLASTSQYYFDFALPLPPQRYYRAWQVGTPAASPSLDMLGIVPVVTLTGNLGDAVRVDYINRFGPIDAWVTLDTVTLTNTSQLYFDISAPGQPERLYRLAPVP